MTAPSHKLGLYFTSSDLTTHGEPLPNRTIISASPLQITINSITQPSDYWNGATGFFTESAPDVLKGLFFHVRLWTAGTDNNPGTLQLYGSLPVSPPAGTVFRLCKGGKFASSQEIPGLRVSGKQPEFDPVSHSTLPGITITKASPSLGEGTLSIRTNARAISAQITNATGFGPPVQLTENANDLVLYTGGHEGWVRLNVNFSQTTNSNVTATFTLQIPKGVLIPDVEADDAADPHGRLRYYCVATRNDTEDDPVSALGAWTVPLASNTATIQSFSSESITLTADPASWPLRGFWVRKISNNTFRYVTNRNGNRLHLKALSRGLYNFSSGNDQLIVGDLLRRDSVTGISLGRLLDLRVTSGSLESGSANVTLMTSAMTHLSASSSNSISIFNARTGVRACTLHSNNSTGNWSDRNFTTPGSWVANDILEPVSDLDIAAIESGGSFHDPENVTDKPLATMMFMPCHSIDSRAIAGFLAPSEYAAFWIQQHILPNVPAHSAVMGNFNFSWY
jgi:hypothetical protein